MYSDYEMIYFYMNCEICTVLRPVSPLPFLAVVATLKADGRMDGRKKAVICFRL